MSEKHAPIERPQVPPAAQRAVASADDEDLLAEATTEAAAGEDLSDRDVVAALTASLYRAARSFVIYEASNAAVATLIKAYRDAAFRARDRIGRIELIVDPFTMVWQGEVVYREPDRERSMAFRIYRDGVRRITLQEDVSWQDLMKLFEVLSVRYKGVRQQEDDTLTLLRQADFHTIEFAVVDAYIPAEEDPEEGISSGYEAPRAAPDSNWDQPLPRFLQAGTLSYRPISTAQLASVLDEHSPAAQAKAAVQAVDELMRIAKATHESAERSALALADEVCKYLVVELRPTELVKVVRAARTIFGERDEVLALERDFGSGEVLDRFLNSPDEVSADALTPLFSLVAADHLERVVDRFISEPDIRIRQALMKILGRVAVGQPDVLLNKLSEVPTERMVDLFNVVAVVAPPERCIEAAYSMTAHDSPDVQLGALGVLAMDSDKERLQKVLVGLLEGQAARVRVEAARILGSSCGARAFRPLRDRLDELAKSGQLEPIEAAAFGRALIAASSDQAVRLMRSWLEAKGLKGMLRKVRYRGAGERMLRWAAVTGLARDYTPESAALLESIAEGGDEKLAEHAKQVLQSFPSDEQLAALAEQQAEARRQQEAKAQARRANPTRGGIRRGSARKTEPK
jgi:hypothetical protein